MADRTVNLVIKAREDAEKAFRSVNAALGDLADAQKEVSAGAASVSQALKGTQSAGKQVETAYERIAESLKAAGTALERQESKVKESRASYNALQAQAKEAARAVEVFRVRNEAAADGRFRSKLKAAEQGYASLQKAIAKAGSTLRSQEDEYERAASNYNQLAFAAREAEKAVAETQQRQQSLSLQKAAEQQQELARAVRETTQAQKQQAEQARKAGAEQAVADQRRLATAFRATSTSARLLSPAVRQVVRELTFMGPAAAQAASGLRRGAAEATNMRQALQAFYGDSRRALSLMQRLRGEVLSLTASFVGFYGVFRTGQSFLTAFQELEAASNRLGAAFSQDGARVTQELEFLRSEAKRLGISFGVLSEQYSKFVISGQQAGLETEQLRTIFTQVAEAGRVLKLSNDQIAGTFTALTQIAGKGTLQMEELRQQLGDRLPGAVGILAQALGYGENELDKFYKAVEQGEVGAQEALVALGEGLQETYGDQLGEVLDTVNTKIGRLQNLLFERKVDAAEAGFISGLETALEALNEFLASDRGIQLFEDLGAAFGKLFELLPGLLDNIDKLVIAFRAFVAIKVAQVASGLAGSLQKLVGPTVAAKREFVRFNRSLALVSPAAGRAVRGATRLGGALRGLRGIAFATATSIRAVVAALGGPIGVAVAGLSFLATGQIDLNESARALNDALREQQTIMGKIGKAYREAGGDAEKFKEKLEDISEIQIRENLRKLRDELTGFFSEDSTGNARGTTGDIIEVADAAANGGEEAARAFREWERLNQEYRVGAASAEEVREALAGLVDALGDTSDGVTEYLAAEDKRLERAEEVETAIERQEAALAVLNGTATEAQKKILGIGEASDEAADGVADAAAKTEAFEEAIRELSRNIPRLNAEMKRFDAIKEIEEDFQNAIDKAKELPDVAAATMATLKAMNLREEAKDAVAADGLSSDFTGADSGVEAARELIQRREGFRNEPYWDVNAFRAGFGSDTVTLADGSIKKITEGMTVSREDALRDLNRRITEEFMPRARQQVGAERFDSFNPQQQGALTSIAYNYGQLPGRIIDELKTGTVDEIGRAIRGLASDNDGINAERRREEAAIFTQSVGEEAATDRAEKKLQEQREFNASLDQQIEKERFLLSIQDQNLLDREVAKALRKAELEAQEAGVELTKEQRAEIEATTRAKFAQEAADQRRNQQLEKARRLEERVTLLQERRQRLQDRLNQFRELGDTSAAAQAETELQGVNAQLEQAIRKARQFWRSIGGPQAEAALQKLKFAQQDLQQMGQKAVVTGSQINNMIADGVASAFDEFARRVANGEDAMDALGAAFRKMAADILRQLAQMIIRQTIFNLISGGQGSGGGGGLGGAIAGGINSLFHSGGIAGGVSQKRTVDPEAMANAIRYHTGGVGGLAPDEVPAVLREGEEVLTENDPRHRFNGGRMGGGGAAEQPTIINAVDGSDALEQALATPRGREVILNYMRKNRDTVRGALEG